MKKTKEWIKFFDEKFVYQDGVRGGSWRFLSDESEITQIKTFIQRQINHYYKLGKIEAYGDCRRMVSEDRNAFISGVGSEIAKALENL